MKQVTLQTLGGGAAIEKFEVELQRVIDNMLDPNTLATASREIVLKVTIKPDQNRQVGTVAIATTCKLASDAPFTTQLFVDKDGVAYTSDPRQEDLFEDSNIKPIGKKDPKEGVSK